ncbi:hypothetical protein TYRP_016945 [Tyrophagus putrescentiae]|nr:hypothetical protein TYRP_016945 [Tyrophagus putrescentiae]
MATTAHVVNRRFWEGVACLSIWLGSLILVDDDLLFRERFLRAGPFEELKFKLSFLEKNKLKSGVLCEGLIVGADSGRYRGQDLLRGVRMTHHDAHHHSAGSQEGQLALNRPLVDDHVLPVKLAVHLLKEVLQVVAFGTQVHLDDVLCVEAAADDAVLLVAVVLYQVVHRRDFVVFCTSSTSASCMRSKTFLTSSFVFASISMIGSGREANFSPILLARC